MAFTKITNTELNSRGATTLPNQPTISATALKQEFDAPAKNIVAPKFNNLVDELEANTAAGNIGATAPTGRSGETVQAVMNDISSDLATLEESAGTAIEDAHTHDNKDLLDTYTQTEEDLASAVADDHTHSNKALLDTYEQTESDLADAVSKKHAHDNKDLLDTYTQTNSDIADAVSKKHSHSNKDLLDTYEQTETNLADAVVKKHSHSNKALLDTYDQTNSDISTAVANSHTHSNKSLLDTYTQTETDIADAVSKKHSHSNKALLDTYEQTETDLADAVSKKHSHSNKTVLDKFGESGGNPTYDGNPIGGGGGASNAYKTVKVGTTNIVASGEDTIEFKAGSNVTLTPDATNKSVTINASGGGTSTGDMLAADYDDDFDVKAAGGIKDYIASKGYISDVSGKADKVSSATNGNFAALDSNGNLTDSGHKHSDYLTSHQDITGKADKVTGGTSGNFASLDSNGNLADSGHKHSDYLTSHQDISGKADKVTGTFTSGNFAGLNSSGNITDSGKKASDFMSATADLDDLADVTITSPSANQVLKYNGTGWVNGNESGGGGGIDGSTVTPTGVIATWLECADLHQSYTTLNEVLADTPVLEALMNSTNAVDYLVRSTTWASSIVADEMAMAYIGANNYCAEILLADSTWRTAICGSTYFESVLNVKVPTLSSNTNVLYSGYTTQYDRQPYYVFDNNDTTLWAVDSTSTPQYIGYEFASDVNVCLVKMLRATGAEIKATLQCSSDGSNWINCESVTYSDGSSVHELASNNTNKNSKWRLYLEASSSNFAHKMVQFYGRSDKPIGNDDAVDTNANISAIAPNEPNATASQAYAAGEHFYKNGKFCTAQTAIASGATFTLGTNYTEGTVADSIERLKVIYTTNSTQTTVANKLLALKAAYDNLSVKDRIRAVIIQNGISNFPEGEVYENFGTSGMFISSGIADGTQRRDDVIVLQESKMYRYLFTLTGISISDFSTQTPNWDLQLAIL